MSETRKNSIMNKLGIYVHIPFCQKKCKYCDFISFSCDDKKIHEYFNSLEKEIDNCKINEEVSTIYIGGGTPSFVNSQYIVNIMNLIQKKFKIKDDAEITIEVNPGTIDKEKLLDYKKIGINRISIGLQTYSDRLLKLIRKDSQL